jgi:peptide/nickel transport system permease protein
MLEQTPDSATAGHGGHAPEPLVAPGGILAAQGVGLVARDREVKQKKKVGPIFYLAFGWLFLIAGAALLAPLLPLNEPKQGIKYDRTSGDLCERGSTEPNCRILSLEEPFKDPEIILGTNKLGRDMLSQTIFGARVSMMVGFASITFGIAIGGTVGLISGYFRGRIDTVLMGIMDILLAFPPLVLALTIVSFRGSNPTLQTLVLSLGIVAIPSIARLTRANTLQHTEREFVLAARTLGASNTRILLREVLPNVVPSVVSFSLLGVAVAIVAEGLLAFLGLSVSDVTWGSMINEGRSDFKEVPHVVMIPCLALWLTVMALNLASDQLRKLFDVKESAL